MTLRSWHMHPFLGRLHGCVRDVVLRPAEEMFKKLASSKPEELEETRAVRRERAEARINLLQAQDEETRERWALVLKPATKKKRALRRRGWRRRPDSLAEQLEETWRARDFAVAWRVPHALADNDLGPKKRRGTAPPAANLEKEEWAQ